MTAKRYLFLLNPRGGHRKAHAVAAQARLLLVAADAQIDVRETRAAGEAAEIVRDHALEGLEAVCVVGGDGTLHEAVNGMMARPRASRIPLALLPAGTGNTVAQHLNLLDLPTAVNRLLTGSARPLDLLRVTTAGAEEYCINIVGWGAAVEINRRAESWRRIGSARYALAALTYIAGARRFPVTLTLDGATQSDAFMMVLACNTKYTGRDMRMAPQAEMDDGLMDVICVRKASRLQLLSLFARVFDGSHTRLTCVECCRVRSLRLENPQPDDLNLDGELKRRTPVSIELVPAALSFVL